MSVRASLLQSEQSSGNSISKNKKAANSGIVTVGLCLPEGEEGTVAVGAVAEEESRALKQAKKHPMVLVVDCFSLIKCKLLFVFSWRK